MLTLIYKDKKYIVIFEDRAYEFERYDQAKYFNDGFLEAWNSSVKN